MTKLVNTLHSKYVSFRFKGDEAFICISRLGPGRYFPSLYFCFH